MDRVKVCSENSTRIQESLELVMTVGEIAKVGHLDGQEKTVYLLKPICNKCEFKAEESILVISRLINPKAP